MEMSNTNRIGVVTAATWAGLSCTHQATWGAYGVRPWNSEEARGEWTYFTGRENATESTSVVKGYRKAAHSYTNDDVTRQNDKNGTVKYDGKTEKL